MGSEEEFGEISPRNLTHFFWGVGQVYLCTHLMDFLTIGYAVDQEPKSIMIRISREQSEYCLL